MIVTFQVLNSRIAWAMGGLLVPGAGGESRRQSLADAEVSRRVDPPPKKKTRAISVPFEPGPSLLRGDSPQAGLLGDVRNRDGELLELGEDLARIAKEARGRRVAEAGKRRPSAGTA